MITNQQVKNEQIKRKNLFFCKNDYIPRKGNNNNKKYFLEKPPITMIIAWYIWAVKDWRLVEIDHWPALICSAEWEWKGLLNFDQTNFVLDYFLVDQDNVLLASNMNIDKSYKTVLEKWESLLGALMHS